MYIMFEDNQPSGEQSAAYSELVAHRLLSILFIVVFVSCVGYGSGVCSEERVSVNEAGVYVFTDGSQSEEGTGSAAFMNTVCSRRQRCSYQKF